MMSMGRRTNVGSLARRDVRGTTVGGGRSAISNGRTIGCVGEEKTRGDLNARMEDEAPQRLGWVVVGEIAVVVFAAKRHQHAKRTGFPAISSFEPIHTSFPVLFRCELIPCIIVSKHTITSVRDQVICASAESAVRRITPIWSGILEPSSISLGKHDA